MATSPTTTDITPILVVGLPRTGTTSLGRALSLALPSECSVVDFGGVMYSGPREGQNTLIRLAKTTPTSPSNRAKIRSLLSDLTSAHVAYVDVPVPFFVEELLSLYPDARVLCSVRDRESWKRSIGALWRATSDLKAWSWFGDQTLRRFLTITYRIWEGRAAEVLPNTKAQAGNKPRWFEDEAVFDIMWDEHQKYLHSLVPSGRLHFIDVKQGWAPLCSALNLAVPEDVPFPHDFSRQGLIQGRDEQLHKMKTRLAMLAAGLVAVAGALVYHRQSFFTGAVRSVS